MIQGLQGCARYRTDRCFISAYDASTGKQVWKFNTIAHTGEPGGDTWGKLPDDFRKGGETWIAGSYDPDLNLTYWGIAQAKPWMPASRGTTVFDAALYTASTVALNVDDGKLAWHFQHVPGESLDLDEVFERVLVDIGDAEVRVHDRQGRHPVEARSPHRQVPRRTRRRSSRTSSIASIRRPACRPIAPTSSSRRSSSGSSRARAPKAATTGRR